MKNNTPTIEEPELSRPLPVEKIPAGGMVEHIVARPDERAALAKRFALLGLSKLEAKLDADLTKAGKIIEVKGTLQADVVQQCVVTLEPIPVHIETKVRVLFTPEKLMVPEEEGVVVHKDMLEEDPPELIIDGKIDLGEVVAQHLALALDPYPRLPGAVLPTDKAEDGAGKAANPFAVLKKLKEKPKK